MNRLINSTNSYSIIIRAYLVYCFRVVLLLLLLFRKDFGNRFEENGKVFKIKTYLALLHLS